MSQTRQPSAQVYLQFCLQAPDIWLIVAPSLIMLMDVDRIINVGWSEKGLKIGWQKQYF
jgi:hypothetical protein